MICGGKESEMKELFPAHRAKRMRPTPKVKIDFQTWLTDQGEGFLEEIATTFGETMARTTVVTAILFMQGRFD